MGCVACNLALSMPHVAKHARLLKHHPRQLATCAQGCCAVQYDVMVTAGANQAFTNIVLTLMDASDRIVLFTPYYFNHLMAVQMTGGGANVVYGKCDPRTWHPDLDWLEAELQGACPPKVVVIVNPCNPTGMPAYYVRDSV